MKRERYFAVVTPDETFIWLYNKVETHEVMKELVELRNKNKIEYRDYLNSMIKLIETAMEKV